MLCGTTTTEAWVAEGRTAQALSGSFSRQPLVVLADVRSSSDGESQHFAGTPERTSVRTHRVLLVDDDEDVLAIMVPFLEEEGFEVVTATTGREALHLVESDKPDVVILDLMMPVVSGWDVWDHMQARPDLARIPVVVFTACGLGPGAFGANVPVVRKGAGTDEILNALSRSLGAP
jgi:two-component system OmpR family response regulator